MIPSEDERETFLEELTKLSNKYKIYIWGCGCCGSPNLERVKSEGFYKPKSVVDVCWVDGSD